MYVCDSNLKIEAINLREDKGTCEVLEEVIKWETCVIIFSLDFKVHFKNCFKTFENFILSTQVTWYAG